MGFDAQQIVLKEFIQDCIYNACHYNIEALEQTYHPSLVIVIINEKGELTRLDREQNMQLFKNFANSGSAPLSTDTEFNYIEVNNTQAQVIVTRRVAMSGRPEKIVFSLYLMYESGRWQIYREMAFAQPEV